jgi:hypothetical protein
MEIVIILYIILDFGDPYNKLSLLSLMRFVLNLYFVLIGHRWSIYVFTIKTLLLKNDYGCFRFILKEYFASMRLLLP